MVTLALQLLNDVFKLPDYFPNFLQLFKVCSLTQNLVLRTTVTHGDITYERTVLKKVAEELNTTINAIAPEKGVVVELLTWDRNAHAGMGEGPQDKINKDIKD